MLQSHFSFLQFHHAGMEMSKCFTTQPAQINPCRMERSDDKKAGATDESDEDQQRGIPGQEMRGN